MSNKLIIVESPTKAKTIQKFLPDYEILASVGHVRDLPRNASEIPAAVKGLPWAYLGVDVEHDFKPCYIIPEDKLKVIQAIKAKAAKAKEIFFATDEDREGESISWHIKEVIQPQVPFHRMVFHEITKDAILKALKQTRTINENLVHAQEARRILDRLVGYTLSPLLWKKIAVGLSAGRVQSVVLQLIVLREKERINFVRAKYFGLHAQFEKDQQKFSAVLATYAGQNLASGSDFDSKTGQLLPEKKVVVLDEKKAQSLKASIDNQKFTVAAIEVKKVMRNPPLPFITSSLQQDANRKLRLGARQTMRIAQSLYEKGFITYMRTDSPNLSEEAVVHTRKMIKELYGTGYAKSGENKHHTTTKNAQEAHEAIRPAGTSFRAPKDTELEGAEFSLYDLIWKRTLASEMLPAEINQTTVFLEAEGHEFRAHGKEILFLGYLKAFKNEEDETSPFENWLPTLKVKEQLKPISSEVTEHSTEEPARYTEASIIKLMEKEAIGRPSTYATIIETLMDRGYVMKKSEALYPSLVAFAVVNLLEKKYPQIVDMNFSARMEQSLDDISSGDLVWNKYLKDFYKGSTGLKATTDKLEAEVSPLEFREVWLKNLDTKVSIGRFGAFVQIEKDNKKLIVKIPPNIPPADLTNATLAKLSEAKLSENKTIGIDKASGLPVYYMTGAFGPYLQLGETPLSKEKGKNTRTKKSTENQPKRVSVKNVPLEKIDLAYAEKMFSLPLMIGTHPESGATIQANIGRYGPYLVHNLPKKADFRSVTSVDELFTFSLDKAVEFFNQKKKSYGSRQLLKSLGTDPETKGAVEIYSGPFGAYVKLGDSNASVPKALDWNTLSVNDALQLIEKKKNEPKKSFTRRSPRTKSFSDPVKVVKRAKPQKIMAKK